MKKYLLGSLVVFVVWGVLDFVVQGVFLKDVYASVPALWRPMGEMSKGGALFVWALMTLVFTAFYAWQVKGNSVAAGAKFGLMYGLAVGIPMGFGNYVLMPIPYALAWGWFLSCLVESVIVGALAGWIIRRDAG